MPLESAKLIDRMLLGQPVPPQIRAELVAMLYPPSFRIGTSMLCSIVCGLVLAQQMHSPLPLAWGAVAFALCLIRAWDWRQYRRNSQQRSADAWARRFTLQFLPFGIWWGLLTAVLFLSDDPITHAIAVMSIVAMCSGAVCSYFCHPPAALSFTLPSMAMFAVGGIVAGGWFGFSVAFIQVVLVANYLIIIREFYGSTIQSLRLRHEKAALAENLAVARAEAEREVQAKSEFLATLSHEIRTPMNAVLGALQMLERASLPPADRGMLDVALRGGARLAALIDDTLDLERITAGAMPLEQAPFDPAKTIEEPVRLLRAEAERKGLALRLRIDPVPALRVVGDARRVEQVVLNLIANAVRYTQNGSVDVSLTTVAAEDGVRLTIAVADTGPGIPDDLQPRLFQPFARGAVHGETGSGTGLGLSIVERLVKAMSGTVRCDSRTGRGTRFEIGLHLPAAAAEAAPAPAPIPADERRLDRSVLLVEDDELSRIVGRALLERLGCRVEDAATGESALEIAAGARFDLVLLDMQLPGIDGLETARRLRSAHGRELRIVAMTANATLTDRTRYANEGLDGFVAKPIRMDVLRTAIEDGADRLPAVPEPPAARPMYDEQLWARLVRDFPVGEAGRFRAQARTVVAERLAALQGQDHAPTEQLIRAVHALSGTAASAGLPALAEAAAALEHHLRTGLLPPLDLAELGALGLRALALLEGPLPAAAAASDKPLGGLPPVQRTAANQTA